MKRLAKVVMMAALVGFAFNAHAYDVLNKVKMAQQECAHKAEMYELRFANSLGYMEMFFNAGCEYKAVIPLFKKAGLDKKPEVKKYIQNAERHYNELKEGLNGPELEEGARALEMGELMGYNIHNRIKNL
ncbi:TPA: hypothetical protein L6746_000661 [Escherichia coli]|nr:hypothetical protein [Escherichia coli]